MYGTLLVPLDGSERAETALRFAELIPSRTIRLITVEPVRLTAARDRWARGERAPSGGIWDVTSTQAYLNLIGLPLREQGRRVEVVVASGNPGERIVEASGDVDLIVMATRGAGATALLTGSTADRVAQRASAPTLLIRELHASDIRPIERLVVPLDGSARAEEAIPLAATMQRSLGVPVSLVRVIDPSTSIATVSELQQAAEAYLERQVQALGGQSRASSIVHVLRTGTVAERLIGAVHPGDVFLLASRRRGRLGHLVFGGITSAMIRRAPVPVILVPNVPGEMHAALRGAREHDGG